FYLVGVKLVGDCRMGEDTEELLRIVLCGESLSRAERLHHKGPAIPTEPRAAYVSRPEGFHEGRSLLDVAHRRILCQELSDCFRYHALNDLAHRAISGARPSAECVCVLTYWNVNGEADR